MTGSHSHGICDAPDVCSVVLWPCPAQPGPALCPRARTSPGWSQATHCCCCCTCCSSSSSLVSPPPPPPLLLLLGLASPLGLASLALHCSSSSASSSSSSAVSAIDHFVELYFDPRNPVLWRLFQVPFLRSHADESAERRNHVACERGFFSGVWEFVSVEKFEGKRRRRATIARALEPCFCSTGFTACLPP